MFEDLNEAKTALNQLRKKVIGLMQVDAIVRAVDNAEARVVDAERRQAAVETQVTEAKARLAAVEAQAAGLLATAAREANDRQAVAERELAKTIASAKAAHEQWVLSAQTKQRELADALVGLTQRVDRAHAEAAKAEQHADAAKRAHEAAMAEASAEAAEARGTIEALKAELAALRARFGG